MLSTVRQKSDGVVQLGLEFLHGLLTNKALGKEFLELDEEGKAIKTDLFLSCELMDDWRLLVAPRFATQWLGEAVDVVAREARRGVKLVLILKAAAVMGEVFT